MGKMYFTLIGILMTTMNIKKWRIKATNSVIAISYYPIFRSLIAVIMIAYFDDIINTYAKRKNTKNSCLMLWYCLREYSYSMCCILKLKVMGFNIYLIKLIIYFHSYSTTIHLYHLQAYRIEWSKNDILTSFCL